MKRFQRGASRGAPAWQIKRQNPVPLMSAGPLLTDHLGLQDIDKELELLQRKREIIEQQQQILSHEFRRNEPHFSQGSRFDDYAQLYDDMRSYDHPSRKRSIPVWEDDIPTKRFSGQSKPRVQGPPRTGRVSGYQGSQPRQPYYPPPKTQPSKLSPKFSRITKTPPAMNKLDTYPVAERKKLVKESHGLADSAKPRLQSSKEPILRADREPTKQMTGRLELALGGIIKEIKLNPQHADAVFSMSALRLVKKTVRDRIREVMMDRAVGSGESIKARYREVYDIQSDYAVVESALAATTDANKKIATSPEDYFKLNMNKIVNTRIKELVDKLEEISTGKAATPKKVDETDDAESKETENELSEESLAAILNSETFLALDRMVTAKVAVAIKKQVPSIIQILNMDARFNQLKNNITAQTLKKLSDSGKESLLADIPNDSKPSDTNTTVEKGAKSPYKPLPYFAKLMGKPSLPKRPIMREFFEAYGPRSIKKHRSMHNLLFVGFNDKESFEKLLAADGTKIGKYTLSIRVSERKDVSTTDLNTSTCPEDKIIGPELDEQISDLLTSIKNETEDNEDVSDENKDNATNEAEIGENEATGTELNNETAQIDNDVTNAKGNDVANAEDNDVTIADNNDALNAEDNDVANAEDNDLTNAEDNDVTNVDDASTNISKDANNEEPPNGENSTQADAAPDSIPETVTNENVTEKQEEAEKTDVLPEMDAKPKGTPVRASARIAGTPGRIQTRRASRFVHID